MNDAESAAQRELEEAEAEAAVAVETDRQARLELAKTARSVASLALLRGDVEKAKRWESKAQENENHA